MKLLYFAWIRTTVGHGEEKLEKPPEVSTIRDLMAWLDQRGGNYARALERKDKVRVAINQEFASLDSPLQDSDEVAFFPPVTGG